MTSRLPRTTFNRSGLVRILSEAAVASGVRRMEAVSATDARAYLDEQARRSPKRISGEQFLALCEGLMPGGAPLQLLASIIQPLYASWGIGTGKERQQAIAAPPGRVLLRVL